MLYPLSVIDLLLSVILLEGGKESDHVYHRV